MIPRRRRHRPRPVAVAERAPESLPFFGTTWVTRGPAYWLRRVWLFFLVLISSTVATVGEVSLYHAFLSGNDLPIAGKVFFGCVLTLALLGSFVQPARRYHESQRRRRAGQLLRPVGQKPPRRARSGGALGSLAYGGVAVAQSLFVLVVAFGYGWFVYMLVLTLQREYGLEHDARLRFEGKA